MDKKDKKAYKRNKEKLKYILNHRELNTVLSQRNQSVVKKAFEILQKQMDRLSLGRKVIEATGGEKSQVKEALNLLQSIIINAPLKPILKDLAIEFGLLAFNWNKVFGKRPDIAQTAVDAKSIVEGSMSLMQATKMIKTLMARVESINHFSPPAFELSKAYLKTLEKDKEV